MKMGFNNFSFKKFREKAQKHKALQKKVFSLQLFFYDSHSNLILLLNWRLIKKFFHLNLNEIFLVLKIY